jgi:hypothetical protein
MGQRQLPLQGGNLWDNQGYMASGGTPRNVPSTVAPNGQDKTTSQRNGYEESSGTLQMKKPKAKLGRLFVVTNTSKQKAANKSYVFTYLESRTKPVPYLFTDSQLKEARDRAIKNSEDCLPLSRWWRF